MQVKTLLPRVQAVDIDRYMPPAPGLQKTSCTPLLLSIDGTDRQTDGRTESVGLLLHRRSPLEANIVNNLFHNAHTVEENSNPRREKRAMSDIVMSVI